MAGMGAQFWEQMFRWKARVFSLLVAGFVGMFAVAEGLPDPTTLSAHELLASVALVAMVFGLLAAWKWELAGALVALAGYATFVILEGSFLVDTPFVLFAAVAVFYLVAAGLKRRHARLQSPGTQTTRTPA